jgi:hypothetical protein
MKPIGLTIFSDRYSTGWPKSISHPIREWTIKTEFYNIIMVRQFGLFWRDGFYQNEETLPIRWSSQIIMYSNQEIITAK